MIWGRKGCADLVEGGFVANFHSGGVYLLIADNLSEPLSIRLLGVNYRLAIGSSMSKSSPPEGFAER